MLAVSKIIKSNYFILPVIFILGLIVRSVHLDFSSLNLDDIYSIYYSHNNWEHLAQLFKVDINPPTYYVTLFAWIKLTGDSVFATRFLSVIFSATSGVFIWLIASKHFTKQIAIIAVSLFLVSSYQLSISLLVRSFAMSQLVALISFYYFLEIHSNQKKINVVLYTVSTALLLNIHQTTFLIPLTQFLLLFTFKWNRKKVLTILGCQGIIILSLLPQIIVFNGNKSESLNLWRVAPTIDNLWSTLVTISGSITLLYFYIISLLIGVFIILKKKESQILKPFLATMLWLCVGFVLAFIVSQKIPFFLPKYLSFLSPPIYLLAGVVIWHITSLNKWLGAILLVVVLLLNINLLNYKSNQLENWKETVPIAKRINQKGYDILVSPVYMYRPFTYYFDKTIFNNVDSIMPIMYNQYGIYFSNTIDTNFFEYRFPKKIALVQAQKGHVDPNHINIKVLNHFYTKQAEMRVDGIELHLYKR